VRGVSFYNDSKATTLESVEAALRSFAAPVLVILGGRLKAGSFTSLRGAVGDHARAVYAIGESRDQVREALEGVRPVHECASLEEAVLLAFEEARPGDTVLLSPGCSSFDMFRDYAERGQVFRRAFERLSLSFPGAA
jgi:UDP-N-acetylmuramoylalanine--D-glutamate ligase